MGNSVTAAMLLTLSAMIVASASLILAAYAGRKAKAAEDKATEAIRRLDAMEKARDS